MEFVVNGITISGLISDRQIEKSIRSLTGEGDSFAILAQAAEVYLQTSGGPSYGFVLEYRDGSSDEHYSCSNFELTADEVIAAFQSYLAGDGRWKTEFDWQPQVFDYTPSASGSRVSSVVIGVAIVALAAVLMWKAFLSN